MRILVLGTGLQGRAALYDLAHSPEVEHVIAADADIAGLRKFLGQLGSDKIEAASLDAADAQAIRHLLHKVQAVITLLPSQYNLSIAGLAVEAGVHLVNSSYTPPGMDELGRLAEEKGLAILPEFGMDPGIDLVLAGQAIRELDQVSAYYSYGSGVPAPEFASGPLKYKISWTFSGVLSAYLRPARLVRDGQVISIPGRQIFAPHNVHQISMGEWGEMEAYPNGDVLPFLEKAGIRDSVRQAARYATRWPGHCAIWYALAQLGFLDENPILVGGRAVVPREFLRSLLEPQLQYGPDERDLALLRVEVHGQKGGREQRIVYLVADQRDLQSGLMAMNRTVGFTSSIGVQMILRGEISKRGLLSPLTDVPFEPFMEHLRARGIHLQVSTDAMG